MIDKLIKIVIEGFKQVKDPRRANISYDLAGLLNLGFAMFHLKESFLSSFREQ